MATETVRVLYDPKPADTCDLIGCMHKAHWTLFFWTNAPGVSRVRLCQAHCGLLAGSINEQHAAIRKTKKAPE
jgi:hypothetical protein